MTPTIRCPGRRSRSASEMPAARPPPPTGIRTVAASRSLLRELEPDRSLAGDHARVLEGVHERRAGARDVLLRGRDSAFEARARQLDLASVGARRLDLRHRRVLGHEDRGGDARLPRGPGDRLPVVAGARGHDARRALLRRERRDRVVRAADLEGARALEVLGLEQTVRPDRRENVSVG